MTGARLDGVAYFTQVDEATFRGNDAARGPWSEDHCHAGPVSGLIARAVEDLAGPGRMLTRLTVDFLRPLPLAGLRVDARLERETRTLATGRVDVVSTDGELCARASSMHLARQSYDGIPTPRVAPPEFAGGPVASFPITSGHHRRKMFKDFNQVQFPPGEEPGPGPTTLWMRTPRLLADEDPSPIQALCPLADCGNGISRNAPLTEIGFMNTDLTLQVHREPGSDWLASQSVSHWQNTGVGMSQSILFDRTGPVGVALQTIVLRPQAR